MRGDRVTFSGHIAGFGGSAGIRMVIGRWARSPFGEFTDAMVQTADGTRILVAPSAQVAEYVSSTYVFDRVIQQPIRADLATATLTVTAHDLDAEVTIGGSGPFDRLLRTVPGPLTRSPAWLRVIDPVASRLVPGVHTAGTAGNGRREYYGVRRTRLITAVQGRFFDQDLGELTRLEPPVRFGFASAPATPQLVTVTTTIIERASTPASDPDAQQYR